MQMSPTHRLAGTSRNILLRQLSAADQALVEPHVQVVRLDRGSILVRDGEDLDALYFPDLATLSLEEDMGNDRRVEIGLVGLEGLIGWAVLLGVKTANHTAVVTMHSGRLLRLNADMAKALCAQSASLAATLLRYVGTMLEQTANSIAVNLEHVLEHRLARFLLMRHDRVTGDLLPLQHQEIADGLNARRASVTDRLHILVGERLIRCTRGRIVIRDRCGLERFAGQAYGGAEARYRNMIAPFGKSALAV